MLLVIFSLINLPVHARGLLHSDISDFPVDEILLSRSDVSNETQLEAQAMYAARAEQFLSSAHGKEVCREITLLMSKAVDLVNAHPSPANFAKRKSLCLGVGQLFIPSCTPPNVPNRQHICETPWTINGKGVVYARIFKNANDALLCNLVKMAGCPSSTNVIGDMLRCIGSEDPRDNSTSAHIETLAFTVIREPLERFVSAYSEIEFRSIREFYESRHRAYGGDERFLHEPRGSVERARMFIVDMLADRFGTWQNYRHLSAQISTITTSHAVILGDVSSLNDAWGKLQRFTGVTSPFDTQCGQHPQTSAASQSPSRAAMQTLLRDNPLIVTALQCSVLLPDYVCLGGHTTQMEAACTKHGFALHDRSWPDHVREIRKAHCPEGVQFFSG